MKHLIRKYLIAAAFLVVIDLVWLLLIIKSKMDVWLMGVARPEAIAWSAIIAWLLIPVGIIFLVERTSKSLTESAIYGGIYGLCLYGVYEFTNYAIIKTWTLSMVVVDTLWGIFICGVTAVFLRFVSKKWWK